MAQLKALPPPKADRQDHRRMAGVDATDHKAARANRVRMVPNEKPLQPRGRRGPVPACAVVEPALCQGRPL